MDYVQRLGDEINSVGDWWQEGKSDDRESKDILYYTTPTTPKQGDDAN